MVKKTLCLVRDKYLSKLFIRYAFGGVGSYLFSLLFTYAFTEWFKINYYVFYVIAATCTTLFNFGVATKFIFRVTDYHRSRFIRFCVLTFTFYLINIYLVKLLVDWLNIHYALSITLVMAFLALTKFLLYDFFVFHNMSRTTGDP
ncbi:hypothetical protein COV18_02055 [Candidatus Woesearchaeota archaeon CG10_big_fil_rev_8_21_14_0_10_37_12]|nr:MAG: hypothetical protein COV18_02055 [Candidatus Woesearchaeota archaeon CG10_big_fil_rev_8_21_14_0_10_37_12]